MIDSYLNIVTFRQYPKFRNSVSIGLSDHHHWSPPWLQVGQRTAEWGGPVQTLDRDTLGDLQGGRLSYALKLSRHTSLNIIGD